MSFNFGGKSTAAPAFGQAAPAFGQAPAQGQPPQFGAQAGSFSFGTNTAQPVAQTPGLFGAANTQAPSTGFSFGTPAPTATSFSLPAASSTPSFGLPASSAAPSFGLPGASSTAPGLFGAQTTTTTNTGLFGGGSVTTATQSSGFGFGGPNASLPTASVAPTLQTSAPAVGLTFGGPTTSATPLAFPTSSTAPATALAFGSIPAASSAAPTLLSFGASTTATTAPALNFGATTATPTLNLAPASTAATTGFSLGGLGGTVATTSLVPASTPATATPANVGLGGVATTQAKAGTKVSTQKEVSPKDQTLPNEILQTVENFKTVVKQQKSYSSDISRCSVRDYRKVEQEIDLLNNLLMEVEGQLQKNRHLTEKLKYDTAKGLQNVEMAQRTQDTPPGLQYENTAPLKFFLDLADTFEREMLTIKFQIESADKYVKNYNNPNQVTHQDIALGMKRLHETFVALAGRLQAVHSQVETQKETYMNIRKHVYNDNSNPFDKIALASSFDERLKRSLIHSPPKIATGPTPFSNFSLGGNGITAMTAQQQAQNPSPMFPGMSTNAATGFGSSSFGQQIGGTQPSNTSLFGSSTLNQQPNFSFNASNAFQLQKPPTGNKRGAQ